MPAPSDRATTVLVVDDNPTLCALVADILTKLRSYRVVTAEDGARGLERYFEEHPACVVVDVNMPNVNGYQLIRALRGDAQSRGTPLVILSAMVQEKDQLAGMLSGADEYLLKPVSALDLVQTIDRVIARSDEERQRRLDALSDALSGELVDEQEG
jgi:CheY-like chemotaxis protein